MKNKGIRTGAVIVIVILVLLQCNRSSIFEDFTLNSVELDSAAIQFVQANRLDSLPSQFYKVSKVTDQHYIMGKSGTMLYIKENTFLDADGHAINENITIELKEIQTLDDFVKTGITTQSNGQLLSTAGSYYINATSDQKQLKINPSVGLHAYFPTLKKYEGIGYFTGQSTDTYNVNWTQTDQTETPFPGPAIKGPKYVESNTYDVRRVKTLLQDIDRHYKLEGEEYVSDKFSMQWNVEYIEKARKWFKYNEARLEAERKKQQLYIDAWKRYIDSPKIKRQLERLGKKSGNQTGYEYALSSLGWHNCDKFFGEKLIDYNGTVVDSKGNSRQHALVHLICYGEMIHLKSTIDNEGQFTFQFAKNIPFEIYITQPGKELTVKFDGSDTSLGELVLD